MPIHNKQAAPGFFVKSPLPSRELNYLDPFLMLDHFGPKEVKEGKNEVVPDHPHRGFETVTFIFSGRAEHKDSGQNHGKLSSGDIQWMTAGSGVVHSESMVPDNGIVHGIQLWINLPREHKMARPHYQDIKSATIPVIAQDGDRVKIRLIAGEMNGAKGMTRTFTPMNVAHIVMKAGGSTNLPIPQGYSTGIYITTGEIECGGTRIPKEHMVVINNGVSSLSLKATQDTELVFLSGKPINEPVAAYGPFVMNTPDEIRQAISDYQNGLMGKIDF